MKKKVSAIFETAAVKPTPSEPREPTGWFKPQLGFSREFAERRLRACATRRLRLLPEEWGAFAESELRRDYDFADLGIRFHVAMGFDDLAERKGFVNARFECA